MGDAPLMVGVSGLRGIVGKSLTPEVAVRYAGAFGGWLLEEQDSQRANKFHPGEGLKRPVVIVGRDGRMGGELVALAAMTGLRSAGVDVIDIGIAMTPTCGVMVDENDCDGAMIVTASHNPQEWNGLKLLLNPKMYLSDVVWQSTIDWNEKRVGTSAPDAQLAQTIVDSFRKNDVPWSSADGAGRTRHLHSATETHRRKLLKALGRCGLERQESGSFHAIADSVNCSGVDAARGLLHDDWNAQFTQLFGETSGIFPHTPEPTAENLSGEGGLCDAVPGLKADVGFAQDPDGDRLAIVDEMGRYIGEEYTLALCAEALLFDRTFENGAPVLVANLSTSRMIDDVAAAHGGTVVRTAVGEANVVEAMKALRDRGENVVLGGEGNGGVIWPEVVYVRDSLSSMALVLSLMARTGKSVSELVSQINSYSAGGAGYAIEKRKQPLASKEDAKPAVERIAKAWEAKGARVDLQDGVRVDQEDAWVHVRASNTEPILRLIAEAPTREGATALLDDVGTLVR